MEYFIKFLVYHMRTVDGIQSSGDKILQQMEKES
jgi:hypothetical protein